MLSRLNVCDWIALFGRGRKAAEGRGDWGAELPRAIPAGNERPLPLTGRGGVEGRGAPPPRSGVPKQPKSPCFKSSFPACEGPATARVCGGAVDGDVIHQIE